MDTLLSLFKTDNIAIILLTIAVAVIWKELKDTNKRTKDEHTKLNDRIIKISEEVGELRGKDSTENKFLVIFNKIDSKLDLILHPKTKKILKD